MRFEHPEGLWLLTLAVPILAFHFKGKDDYILMRCNKAVEISIKGKAQIAGEVKFFAYSDFSDFSESDVLLKLRDEIILVELYRKGAIEAQSFKSWTEFERWLAGYREGAEVLHGYGSKGDCQVEARAFERRFDLIDWECVRDESALVAALKP